MTQEDDHEAREDRGLEERTISSLAVVPSSSGLGPMVLSKQPFRRYPRLLVGMGVPPLSKAEQGVLQLMYQGKGTMDIARGTFRSPKTISTLKERIRSKLGSVSNAHTIAVALELGLVGRGLSMAYRCAKMENLLSQALEAMPHSSLTDRLRAEFEECRR